MTLLLPTQESPDELEDVKVTVEITLFLVVLRVLAPQLCRSKYSQVLALLALPVLIIPFTVRHIPSQSVLPPFPVRNRSL